MCDTISWQSMWLSYTPVPLTPDYSSTITILQNMCYVYITGNTQRRQMPNRLTNYNIKQLVQTSKQYNCYCFVFIHFLE